MIRIRRNSKYEARNIRKWSRSVNVRAQPEESITRSVHTAIRSSTPVRDTGATDERSADHDNDGTGDQGREHALQDTDRDE